MHWITNGPFLDSVRAILALPVRENIPHFYCGLCSLFSGFAAMNFTRSLWYDSYAFELSRSSEYSFGKKKSKKRLQTVHAWQ
jgi:hypothetical protein